MHPDKRLQWHDEAEMRAFVQAQSFGALFVATPDGPRVAHVPVILRDERRIAFHISRANAVAGHLQGSRALFVAQGAQGYISPDWYALPDQVPTWNYLAVEAEGVARQLDDGELVAIVDAVSDEHERRLAPKPLWTREKMSDGLFEGMMKGIIGFELEVEAWRGTRKLGQNKPESARLRVADALEQTGRHDLAGLMRRP